MTRTIRRAFALALAAALVAPATASAIPMAPTAPQETVTKAFTAQKKAHEAWKRKQAAKAFSKARKGGRISRAEVVDRGRSWVRKNVAYSQSRYYAGYRTDCSGFVSMAWKANSSYTTRSIGAVSRRIPTNKLRAGDAVLYPGHVVLFVKWKDKSAGTFVAYEQANSRKDCIRSVKSIKRGAKAMRYSKIY